MTDDEAGDEAAFVAMLKSPREYGAWAAKVRQQWEREHGVEWLHGARWRSTRPPDDPERPATWRFNPERAARYRAKLAELAAAASTPSIRDDVERVTHLGRQLELERTDATRSGTHPRTRG